MFNDFKNAFQRHNNAHAQLIIINVVIFLAMGILFMIAKLSDTQSIFQVVYDQFVLPSKLSEFLNKPWTLITYAFAHAYEYELGIVGISHILMNMLAIYWFGKLFIEYLGNDKIVALYILGALSGGLLYLLLFNTVPFFIARPSLLVGASGAVFAIVVATATLLPNYTFYLLFLGPIRIKYIAAFYVVASFISSVGNNAGGEIAHLGGALMGFVYIKQLQAGVNWGMWITVTIDWFKDLFKSKPKVKVTYRKDEKQSAKPSSPNKASQSEIDAILDKISDRGYESLTKVEKEKLFNASKK